MNKMISALPIELQAEIQLYLCSKNYYLVKEMNNAFVKSEDYSDYMSLSECERLNIMNHRVAKNLPKLGQGNNLLKQHCKICQQTYRKSFFKQGYGYNGFHLCLACHKENCFDHCMNHIEDMSNASCECCGNDLSITECVAVIEEDEISYFCDEECCEDFYALD